MKIDMRNRTIALVMAMTAIASGAFADSYTRQGNSVEVNIRGIGLGGNSFATAKSKPCQKVRLQVMSPTIIRVEATAENTFPKKESLIIVPQKNDAKFEVSEKGYNVVVTTDSLVTTVNTNTGRVIFADRKGRVILSEVEDGRTFTPYRVPTREIGMRHAGDDPETLLTEKERNGWTWQQRFVSPADEAFYGLGQHQAEEFNYKGKNEELFQYNTKVSVPFIMSNRGYGLLWDSYSLGRWGNPSPYLSLGKVFRLYDDQGEEGAITGTYTDKDKQTITRREDSLRFEDIFELKHLPKIDLNGANVVYSGFIEAPETGDYDFKLYYAGYTRILIDGKEVVSERWRTAWNPNSWKFKCRLQKGVKTPVRIEWAPDGGQSYCALTVADPSTAINDKEISIWQEMDRDEDYYFIAGATMDSIISGYRQLTGKSVVYPKWALGYWQSRERYNTSDEITGTVAEFRKRHLPIDNIVQDWFYWKEDSWGSHQFDPARYPNPQKMLDDVHRMHGRFMISVWPKFYHSTANFKELEGNGWMYCQAVNDSIRDWVGPGYVAGFYDAYSAGARKMFWRQMDENLYSKYNKGIDAWWMDASEPNVRDCTPLWYRKALCGPTALGSSSEYFNAYSIVNADAIYNGQRSINPNTRVFLLTRSGFAGEQRYSTATWSGDIGTRWEDMRAQVTAGINYSMCGLPFWGMDQGGFCVENRYVDAQKAFNENGTENEDLQEWRELQTRWTQLGCFVPLFRVHGQWPQREPWNVSPDGHSAYKSFEFYDNLRYYMMPYLYSLAGQVYLNDYTMMRGLAMDFGSDKNVLNIGDQWMLGPAIMACPVMSYKQRSRSVYLPAGNGWYNLYDGTFHKGGATVTADAPYERIPVYVKAGSIVPFGPRMEWSDERRADTINLYVFTGGDAEFLLYEDEGVNYNYEKGLYTTINIKYDESENTLTLGRCEGAFPGMLMQRYFNIIEVSPKKARSLDLDKPKGKMVKYEGKEKRIKL